MTSVGACIKVRIMEENKGAQPPQKTGAERQRDYRARQKIKLRDFAFAQGVPLKDVLPKRMRKTKVIGPKPLPKSQAERQRDCRRRKPTHFGPNPLPKSEAERQRDCRAKMYSL